MWNQKKLLLNMWKQKNYITDINKSLTKGGILLESGLILE